jgi:hypothetical protein
MVRPPEHKGKKGELSERRESNRFPLQEDLQYRVLSAKNEPVAGIGHTLDMSSSGILFTVDHQLPLGRQVELSVNWPARIDGTCPLKFVAVCRVVRAETERAAVRIERYEFRTRGNSGMCARVAGA